jgi:hypothetical protein
MTKNRNCWRARLQEEKVNHKRKERVRGVDIQELIFRRNIPTRIPDFLSLLLLFCISFVWCESSPQVFTVFPGMSDDSSFDTKHDALLLDSSLLHYPLNKVMMTILGPKQEKQIIRKVLC